MKAKKALIVISYVLLIAIIVGITLFFMHKVDEMEKNHQTEIQKYQEEIELWKAKYLGANSTTESNVFESVNSLLYAIRTNPSDYTNKKVTVIGTICKSDSILALVDLNEIPSKSSGVAFRYEVRNNPNIDIEIADDLQYTVSKTGDYVKLTGTVIISNDSISLINCTYEMIALADER